MSRDNGENGFIYLLYACDEWKSRDSMRLVGATTDRETLYAMMAHEIFEGRMDFDGATGILGLKHYREAYNNGHITGNMLDYGYVDESPNYTLSPSTYPEFAQLHELINMDDKDFKRTFPVPPYTPVFVWQPCDEPDFEDGMEP